MNGLCVADDSSSGKGDTLGESGAAKHSEGGKHGRWHSPTLIKTKSYPPSAKTVDLSVSSHSDAM